VTGPLVGGVLLEHFAWGSIFLINVPVVIVMLAATYALIPRGRSANPPPIDLVGTLLSILALTGFLIAIIAAPENGWTSRSTALFTAGGAAAFGCLVLHLWRSPDPIIDLRLFRDPRLVGATVGLMCFLFGSFSLLYARSQLFQLVLGYSPLQSGLLGTPVALASILVAPASGRIVRRFGHRVPVVVGFTIMATGIALIARLDESSGVVDILWRMVWFGLGTGMLGAPLSQTVIASFQARRAGVASGFNDTARQVGGAVGIAVSGSIIATVYAHRLADDPASTLLRGPGAESARHSVGAALEFARSLPAGSGAAVSDAARDAWVHGYRWGLLLPATVVLGGTLLAAVTLPRKTRPAAAARGSG
jgi:MFS family permease